MSSVLNDNRYGSEPSFLFKLHEKSLFDKEAFMNLCDYLNAKSDVSADDVINAYFVQSQILKHIIFHFDPDDASEISDLPADYFEYLEILDTAISNITSKFKLV